MVANLNDSSESLCRYPSQRLWWLVGHVFEFSKDPVDISARLSLDRTCFLKVIMTTGYVLEHIVGNQICNSLHVSNDLPLISFHLRCQVLDPLANFRVIVLEIVLEYFFKCADFGWLNERRLAIVELSIDVLLFNTGSGSVISGITCNSSYKSLQIVDT